MINICKYLRFNNTLWYILIHLYWYIYIYQIISNIYYSSWSNNHPLRFNMNPQRSEAATEPGARIHIASSSQGDPATQPQRGRLLSRQHRRKEPAQPCGHQPVRPVDPVVFLSHECRSWAHPVYTRWARCDWRFVCNVWPTPATRFAGWSKQKTTAVL